jgi:hypothetical protein
VPMVNGQPPRCAGATVAPRPRLALFKNHQQTGDFR